MATQLLAPQRSDGLGTMLDDSLGHAGVVLHDSSLPGTRSVDHVVLASSGVWLIDVNRHPGLAHISNDDTANAFRSLIESTGMRNVPVHPVVCIVDDEWAQRSNADVVNGVLVLSPDKLCSVVAQPGPVTPDAIEALAVHLAAAARN